MHLESLINTLDDYYGIILFFNNSYFYQIWNTRLNFILSVMQIVL